MGEVGKVGAGLLPCWVLGSGQRLKDRVNGRGRPWAVGSGTWPRAGAVALSPAFALIVRWAPPGDFYDRRLLPRLVLGVRGRGAVEIPKGHGCTDPWLPNNKQHTGSRGSLRKGGSSQGHSPRRPVVAPSLDPGLLTPLWSLRRSWWPSWGGRQAGPGPEPGLLFGPSPRLPDWPWAAPPSSLWRPVLPPSLLFPPSKQLPVPPTGPSPHLSVSPAVGTGLRTVCAQEQLPKK